MRYPAVAGRFYPNDRNSLMNEIKKCFTHKLGPGLPGECSNERKIVSAIAPHAGYAASGMNAAHVYKAIAEDGLPEVYVVIGPDHHGIPYDAAVCGEPYVTPLGVCKVHQEAVKKISKLIPNDAHAHTYEHSVEVQIPFIQFIDPDAKIVPIIMSDQSPEGVRYVSEAVEEVCDGIDHLVIASSDLSHYVPREQARSEGDDVIAMICGSDIRGMYEVIDQRSITACGFGPMAVAMSSPHTSAKLLKYSDSFDSLGSDRGGVVAYVSSLFLK